MASKRGKRPVKIKDIKSKKVGSEKAKQVKGGSLIAGPSITGAKIGLPIDGISLANPLYKKSPGW